MFFRCSNSMFIEQIQINVCTPNPFPRGEGAPKGRMRNAGSNVANQYSVSDLLPCRKCIGGLYVFQICQVTARIPHQSKIGSEEPIFASFSPGEAIGAVRLTNSPINRNLKDSDRQLLAYITNLK